MTVEVATLREVIAQIADMTRRGNPNTLLYKSMYDFVDQHGVEYEPGGENFYPEGTPRACFQNSALAAACYHELRYVEGFAWTDGTFGLPIHHAWNLDTDGTVVDTTWGATGIEYLGIEFPMKMVSDAVHGGTGSVLDDWERGFPLYAKPWVPS